MLEKHLEQKFVQAVKKQGGMALKFVSPGLVGVPDRIVILPGAPIGFVELKAPGGKLKPIQKAVHAKMRKLGARVLVLDHQDQINTTIKEIKMSERILKTPEDFDEAPKHSIITWAYDRKNGKTEVAVKNWEGEWETTCPYDEINEVAISNGELAAEIFGESKVLRWGLE